MCKNSQYKACTSKLRYGDEFEANKAATQYTRQRGGQLRSYYCQICGGWHLTRQPLTTHEIDTSVHHPDAPHHTRACQEINYSNLPVPIRNHYASDNVRRCLFRLDRGFEVEVIKKDGKQDEWKMVNNSWVMG